MSKLSDFFKQFRRQHFCSIVVVAAGSSTRAGKDKLFALLNGVPVIAHTLKTFEDSACVDEIILVTREDKIAELAELCDKHDFRKVTKVICGGETRTASAYIGVMEVSRKADVIAIHDGARPFAGKEVFERTLQAAKEHGAAIAAVPVKDTIKVVNEGGEVTATPNRSTLYAVQTPQIFEVNLLKRAYQFLAEHPAQVTDDASVVELLGHKVVVALGRYENIKITTPEDLLFAENLLAQQEKDNG